MSSIERTPSPPSPEKKSKRQPPPDSVFTLAERIGKGSFAIVYKGKWGGDLLPQPANSQPRLTVAVKVVHRAQLRRDARLMGIFEGEMSILKQMKHPHIVRLFDVVQTSADYNLIMEYCALGDLSSLIRHRRRLIKHSTDAAELFARFPSAPDGGLHPHIVKHVLAQLSSALAFLRSHNLVHRDLKPQNLLLRPPPASMEEAQSEQYVGRWDMPVVKVADFGFARVLPAAAMAETLCGSPLYMAPEILSYEKYNARADLWSVGAVTYEMLTGKPPFPAANHIELMKKIDSGVALKFPEDADNGLVEIVLGLLKRDPEMRMSFDEFFARISTNNDTSCLGELSGQVQSLALSLERSLDESIEKSISPRQLSLSPRQTPNPPSSLRGVSERSARNALMGATPLSPLGPSSSNCWDVAVKSPSASPSPESSDLPKDEYVFIEKRMVEVNALADDVQHPQQRRLTNPEKKPRRRRLSSIAHGASPTNALAQALFKSSMRLFGTKESNEQLSPRIGVPLAALVGTPKSGDRKIIDELEKLATIAKVVSLYADVKYAQLDPNETSDASMTNASAPSVNLSVNLSVNPRVSPSVNPSVNPSASTTHLYHSHSPMDPYFQLTLASEALALHLKALGILSRAMDAVSEWWDTEPVKETSVPVINSLVQWIRDKFNECIDRAEQEKVLLSQFAKDTGTAPPEQSAERLLFDRGLEMAKAAAVQEITASESRGDARKGAATTSEMNYGTAVWMLRALMVSEQGEELSDDDQVMVETLMGKIAVRLSSLRGKYQEYGLTPP